MKSKLKNSKKIRVKILKNLLKIILKNGGNQEIKEKSFDQNFKNKKKFWRQDYANFSTWGIRPADRLYWGLYRPELTPGGGGGPGNPG